MTKNEYLTKIKIEMLYAKKNFSVFREQVEISEDLILKGFEEEKLNNPYNQNSIRILSSFITNGRVRNVIKLLQEVMKNNE